jgi:hypothetical protein
VRTQVWDVRVGRKSVWLLVASVTSLLLAGSPGPAQAVPDDVSCGRFEYSRAGPPRIVGDFVHERVDATFYSIDGLHYRDEFPYPWIYRADSNDDPWLGNNADRKDLTPPIQFPPPGFDTTQLPSVIALAVARTSKDGHTVLQPCIFPLANRISQVEGAGIIDTGTSKTLAILLRYSLLHRPAVDFCAQARNTGDKPITRFVIALSLLDRNRILLGTQELVRTSLLPVGLSPEFDCIPIGDGWPAGRINEIEHMRAAVQSIQYADGTSWTRQP